MSRPAAKLKQAGIARVLRGDTVKELLAGRERRMMTPAAANNSLKTMRAIYKWAYQAGHAKTNPAPSVKLLPHLCEGFTPWTQIDLDAYRGRWRLGTTPQVGGS